ncbi:unnamed protein product [Dimorphilus gyrociliatus]|uniref:Uncharacterized protein n=1 Tax=Dimorphilus gyrociliatus TaxID=2664684 RepID=A0A7I8WEQ0_9ANNE|nr:unnamed protein product [Dimorphilus gyrociliatus]
MPRKRKIKTVTKGANSPNRPETFNQQTNMVNSVTFEQRLNDQRRMFEEKLEESNTQNRAAMEARMDQLVQLVNSIKYNLSNKIPSNSGDALGMEHFPTAEEQNGGSPQVRNISNPTREAKSSSKQVDPRIENLKHKKVTPSEVLCSSNYQDFLMNVIVPLLEADISESEK